MHPYFERLGRDPIVLPVIHILNTQQAYKAVRVAKECGAAGYWLIRHKTMDYEFINEMHEKLFDAWPEAWIGVTYYGKDPERSFQRLPKTAAGFWTNTLGLTTPITSAQPRAVQIVCAHENSRWPGLHFAGVAFKHQPEVRPEDWGNVAAKAKEFLADKGVIVTSGTETGVPPSYDKIIAMRKAIGPDYPLAIASGIDETNISRFATIANCFMVRTSITTRGDALDPKKLERLIELVKS